jgi:hypothetical protein
MGYPSFYSDAKPIVLHDPLADFLGAAEAGCITIDYLDCVKLAGHSCPTVAGAYRMAQTGLAALYPDTLPQRSEIQVELSSAEDEGVIGVIGNVIGYICGASGIGGFKGIGGQFARNDRLRYSIPFDGEVRLSRIDTDEAVILRYSPAAVPGHPDTKPLMQKSLRNEATPEEMQRFQTLWQSRTQAILTAQNTTPFLTLTKETPS